MAHIARRAILGAVAGSAGIALTELFAGDLPAFARRSKRVAAVAAASSHSGCTVSDEGVGKKICCVHDDPTQIPPTVTDCAVVIGPSGSGPGLLFYALTRNGEVVPFEEYGVFPVDVSCAMADYLTSLAICAP